ncbi:MAG: hypothetical protein EHM28_09005 [Spirochaetaceae bacterium]|nr:MAG: hypothetical protein EHM28_09005 [Spirochaetaceae bacterium]
MDSIIGILMDWHVAIVLLVLLFLFPLIFYLSSMDRSPVRIKRVHVQKKKPAKKSQKPVGDLKTRGSSQDERDHRLRLEERERINRDREKIRKDEPARTDEDINKKDT